MTLNLHNMLLNLLAVEADGVSTGLNLRSLIAAVFAIVIGLGAFYMGRAIPRMMVEGKKLLELISGVLMAVVLFWVAWQSLDAASWGTLLLLVSVVVNLGILATFKYLGFFLTEFNQLLAWFDVDFDFFNVIDTSRRFNAFDPSQDP